MVPKSCPANPRTEWARRGAGPATFSLTAVRAARAARGTLWPLAPPPCQVGSKPAGRGFFGRHTETPAAGRGLNWSRRGQGQPFKLSSGPCRLHLKWAGGGRGVAKGGQGGEGGEVRERAPPPPSPPCAATALISSDCSSNPGAGSAGRGNKEVLARIGGGAKARGLDSVQLGSRANGHLLCLLAGEAR
jgi:hypothetical protein